MTNSSDGRIHLEKLFDQIFGGPSRLYRAPGRVNLIGEHTDYNQGFVMPAAIGIYCWVAIAARDDRKLQIHSSEFDATVTVDLDDLLLTRRGDWSDYVVGTAVALRNSGYQLRGANIFVHGQVPIGSGLSSSAAIEVSTGFALLDVSRAQINLTKLALACRHAENEFVGARVGIMDQFICAHGRAGQALMLDCRSLESRALPIPSGVLLGICNTGVKHQIAGGEYNVRRAQCEQGVKLLSTTLPEIRALRDVTPRQLEQHRSLLPEVIYHRCRHVVTENERVLQAADALLNGDLNTVGKLMAESHRSLRDDYQVSCAELDTMVEIACAQPGVVGARMTGGGFGGCTINLVHADAAEKFKLAVATEYEKRTRIRPDIYVVSATEGVQAVTPVEPISV
ncbi:MAG TPA: galactokinase [Candidatus Sulfotelmatobacter sp.]|nr:galactokinase [Candidatus Sulfotelmatobacter sp.]